jgi:hypothetical protein
MKAGSTWSDNRMTAKLVTFVVVITSLELMPAIAIALAASPRRPIIPRDALNSQLNKAIIPHWFVRAAHRQFAHCLCRHRSWRDELS